MRANRIGPLTTDRAVDAFPLPSAVAGPLVIAPGPDGACWFSLQQGGAIGRIDPPGEMAIPPLPRPRAGAFGNAAGPGGATAMWFAAEPGAIGRVVVG